MAQIENGLAANQWAVDSVPKAGRAILYDALGFAIESVVEGAFHYLGVSLRQDVRPSAVNSSTAPIANGGNFPGAVESTLGVAGIQINTYIDRPHTVLVYQGKDAGSMRLMCQWTVPASRSVVRTVQATSSFWQIVVTNTGASPSTVTDINCALCPVVEAVPAALTQGGNLKVTPTAEWQDNNLVTGLYAATTFRTLGSAATPQNLVTIENPAANLNNVVIRDLTIMSDSTVALLTLAQQAILSKPAVLPTGGTALTAVPYRSGYPAATAIVRGATASDGGVATSITATAGSSIWQQYLDRQATNVGLIGHPNYRMVPDVGADLRQLILAPGESALVQITGAAAATVHMICNLAWTEYLAK
jgi:hypothetical protein